MGRNFVFGCVFFFFFLFVFHAKPGTTNDFQTGFSDVSYESPYNRSSHHIRKFQKKNPSVEKNRFENFDFLSYFEQRGKRWGWGESSTESFCNLSLGFEMD